MYVRNSCPVAIGNVARTGIYNCDMYGFHRSTQYQETLEWANITLFRYIVHLETNCLQLVKMEEHHKLVGLLRKEAGNMETVCLPLTHGNFSQALMNDTC